MSTKQLYSSILSANPYKPDWYHSSLTTLSRVTSVGFGKDQYAITFLPAKDFITALIGVSRNIPEDDAYDALETKVYEELALDMAMEYNIKYVEAPNKHTDTERFYHVFVVDPMILEQMYVPVVSEIKYVDQLIPIPLLFKSLYVQEIIEAFGTHVFLYFQENDAFVCIYEEQEFTYVKSLKFSLEQMHEHFCDLLGEQMDKGTFRTLLTQEGLNADNMEHRDYLTKIFGEILLHVNDVLTYAKRAYEIKKIDHIFIGTEVGPIMGLGEYTDSYLGMKAGHFDFEYNFVLNESYVDQIHQLMHLFGRVDPEARYECNFSIFDRPPPFIKRDSGRLILVSLGSLVIAFAYPGVYWGLSYYNDFSFNRMTKEYERVHQEKMEREQIINLKTANKANIQKLYDEQLNNYHAKQDTLTMVREKKVNYPMKAKLLAEFTQSFNLYNVQLRGVQYSEIVPERNDTNATTPTLPPLGLPPAPSGTPPVVSAEANVTLPPPLPPTKVFRFFLISNKAQDITGLLKYLTATKNDRYEFQLDLIEYDLNVSGYLSEMRAILR